MYIFKYFKDYVQRDNGAKILSFSEFVKKNPHIPLVEGEYFEYTPEGIILIDENGYGNWGDVNAHKKLIDAIETAPEPNRTYEADADISAYMELDGIELTDKKTDKIAVSFTINERRKQVWQYRDKTEEELAAEARVEALDRITRLEKDITPRRMREALIGKDAGWLAKQEKKIEKERNKLKGD